MYLLQKKQRRKNVKINDFDISIDKLIRNAYNKYFG
jgi:hypothetical protein